MSGFTRSPVCHLTMPTGVAILGFAVCVSHGRAIRSGIRGFSVGPHPLLEGSSWGMWFPPGGHKKENAFLGRFPVGVEDSGIAYLFHDNP